MRTIEEKVGTEAWEAMSADERNAKYKVYRADCWQHLRNIMIEAMARKGDELVQDAVKDSLELFSSFERIEVEGNAVIRQAFKQLHHGGEYCKGRGREFEVNRKKKRQDSLFIPFERAMGSRQDLKFDGCVPLFWNRMIILDFVRGYVDCPKSENQLDKSLYTLLRCNEFVALLRVNTLWKYVFSEPFRWLAGKTSKLKGWSLFKMAQACEYAEKAMDEIVADPSRLLDPNLDIFAPVAAEVPEFKDWQQKLLDTVVKAEDGTEHYLVREVLRKARTPPPGSGEHQATELALKLAAAQAARALEKMHDPKLAIADKLASQGGANAFGANADGHARTQGVHGTNDSSENKFSIADYVMRTYRGISTLHASGIVQQRTAHDFDRPLNIVSDRRKRKASAEAQEEAAPKPGFFWSALTTPLRHSLVEMARRELLAAVKVGRQEKQSHDEEKLARREEALTRQLNLAVERYAAALELYDQWKTQGVKDRASLEAALEGLSANDQLAELRRQVEMRTVGLGWHEFAVKWGYEAGAREQKADELKRMLLNDILPHEMAMKRKKKLPAEAAPPQLRTRVLKELGTADADALRLEATSLFNVSNLLVKAQAERARREAAGISDSVEACQPLTAPPFNTQLVGKYLEVLWPYKENGKTKKIWASGKIVRVADGLTDKSSARAKKILPAGALLWAWEADADYDEEAGEQWLILKPEKWRKQTQYAWRYDPCELGAQGQPKPPPRRPSVDPSGSDEEYLASDDEAMQL